MVTSRIPKKLIDSEIRRAETLPTRFYKEQKYFELAVEKIFAKSWQFAFTTDALKDRSATPLTILPGSLDEPIVFTRSKDGVINCLSNVCTHRGNLVVNESCNSNQLRCGYHGRCFSLDGRFASTPGFDAALDFPAERDNLSKVPMEFLDKFVFVGVEPAYPFEEFIDGIKSRLSWLPLQDFEFAPELSPEYLVKTNWLLYAENYLEGFHIPYVHPGLAATLDIRKYRNELYKYSNVQIGVAAEGEEVFDFPESAPDFGERINAFYYFLFPNMTFNFYPWGLSVNVIEPRSMGETKVRFLTYIWDKSKFDPRVIDLLHQTELEDETVVQQIAKGVKSRFYKRGRYSPQWEQNVHHFQQFIAEALQDEE